MLVRASSRAVGGRSELRSVSQPDNGWSCRKLGSHAPAVVSSAQDEGLHPTLSRVWVRGALTARESRLSVSGSVTSTRVPGWFAGDTDLGAVLVGDPAGCAVHRTGAA